MFHHLPKKYQVALVTVAQGKSDELLLNKLFIGRFVQIETRNTQGIFFFALTWKVHLFSEQLTLR